MKEIDIDITNPVLEGALFTIRAANGTQYPILTVFQDGVIRHRLPAGTPFRVAHDGGIQLATTVKG